MLTERDPAKRTVIEAVVERIQEVEVDRRRDLAIRIHNALNGKA